MVNRIENGGSDSLLSPTTVAQMLGLSTRHVLRLPIKQLRIGHHTVRYRRADVEAFLERCRLGE
jgi:predicted DNA-binding transcriptional regulator AlpA